MTECIGRFGWKMLSRARSYDRLGARGEVVSTHLSSAVQLQQIRRLLGPRGIRTRHRRLHSTCVLDRVRVIHHFHVALPLTSPGMRRRPHSLGSPTSAASRSGRSHPLMVDRTRSTRATCGCIISQYHCNHSPRRVGRQRTDSSRRPDCNRRSGIPSPWSCPV